MDPFLVRGASAAALLAVTSAAVGPLIVYRGITFVVGGVAHSALAGAALGILLGSLGLPVGPTEGALVVSALFAALVAVGGGTREREEAAVGAAFAASMSLAVLLLYWLPPEKAPQVWGYLVGDVLLLSPWDLLSLAASAALVTLSSSVLYREFLYSSFDPEGLSAYGMRVRAYEFGLMLMVALAVASAVRAVGAIVVYALLVVPAAAAARVARTVRGCVVATLLISLLSSALGIALGYTLNVSPSAAAGLVATGAYLASLVRSS